ncbi:TIGR03773 family transporter-associated surface protein [Corynebacterium frankenforstense]
MSIAPVAEERLELDHGHVDAFNVTAQDGSLHLDLKEDVTGSHVTRDPADVLLRVKGAAYTEAVAEVPEVGKPGYFLPQAQDHDNDLLWPGWDTLGVAGGGFNAVDIEFEELEGPGEVHLFQFGSFGEMMPFGESTLLESGSVIHQAYPAHTHANWVFTEPGVYRMTVRATAGDVSSESATYTWLVGDDAEIADGAGEAGDPGNTDNAGEDPGVEDAGVDSGAGTGGDTSGDTGSTNNGSGSTSGKSGKSGGKQAAGGKGSGSTSGKSGKPGGKQAAGDKGSGSASSADGSGSGDSGSAAGSGDAQCVAAVTPLIKDDRANPAKWRDPAEMNFGLGSAAEVDLPQDLGPVPAGKAWMIGSAQQAGVPWLGANTQHETMREHTSGEVTWQLTSFEGPGPMYVYTQGQLGQVVGEEWFTAADGQGSGTATLAENSHVHPSWVFGEAGTYRLGIRQTVQLNDGREVSGTGTVTFTVGGTGNADEGHFDLGAAVNPDGESDCANGSAGGAAGGSGAAGGAGGPRSLAKTGANYMTLPYAVAGLGVLVLGLGVLAGARSTRR